MFQLLSPKVDCSRATFRRDAHRKRPQSCPQGLKKWFITFTSPSTNQLPAWAWNHGVLWFCPAWSICNLHTIGSLFSWALLPVLLYGAIHNKIGNISPLQFSVSSVWLCRPWVDEPFLFGNTKPFGQHSPSLSRHPLPSYFCSPHPSLIKGKRLGKPRKPSEVGEFFSRRGEVLDSGRDKTERRQQFSQCRAEKSLGAEHRMVILCSVGPAPSETKLRNHYGTKGFDGTKSSMIARLIIYIRMLRSNMIVLEW